MTNGGMVYSSANIRGIKASNIFGYPAEMMLGE